MLLNVSVSTFYALSLCYLLVCLTEDAAVVEMSPEKEARHLIKKIRRQVRLLNRKWAEMNQACNEWQARIEETSEVRGKLGTTGGTFTCVHAPVSFSLNKRLLNL